MWSKTYGGPNDDSATAMVQTSDGGYAILGTTESFNANGADWLVKIGAFGNMEWNQTIKFGDSNRLTSLIQTSDGGYALTGYTHMSFEPNGFWLVKTDKSGNMEWNQLYGGDVARELVKTSDGGFALAGTAWFGPGNCWFIKTDMYGNKEWVQKYTEGEFFSLIEASDRGFALAGYKKSLDAESRDFWLVKTDEYGAVPEFQFWVILPLLMIIPLIVIVLKKKGFCQHKKGRSLFN
jgi:hypothetical protein